MWLSVRPLLLSRHRFFLLAALAGLVVPGCGPGTPFPMVQIEGTVTYEDGSPIPGDRVTVTFIPQVPPVDERTHPRSAYAVVDRQTGAIGAVTTSRYGDGLIRGKHKVTVVSVDNRDRQLPVIPAKYSNSKMTPLEFDTAESPLKLLIPRPQDARKSRPAP